MKSLPVALASVAALTVPALAIACGGPGGQTFGTAAFRDGDTISVMRAENERDTEWAMLADPFQRRDVVGSFKGQVLYSAEAPQTMRLSPAGDRQVLFAPGAMTDEGGSGILYDIGRDSSAYVDISALAGITIVAFDAAFTADGSPLVLLHDGTSLRLLRGPSAPPPVRHLDSGLIATGWSQTAMVEASACAMQPIALALEAGGSPIAFCGDRTVSFASDFSMSIGDPLVGGTVQGVSLTHDTDGTPVAFFARTNAAADGTGNTTIARATRAAGAWTTADLLTVPMPQLTGNALAAANANTVAVEGLVDWTETLYVVAPSGSGWSAESAGPIDYDDHLEATTTAAGTVRILTASMRLRLHQKSADGWETRDLGAIGVQGTDAGFACSVSGLGVTIPVAGPALLSIAVLLAAVLLRRTR